MFAMVDDGDFEWLSQWKWMAAIRCGVVYAGRSTCVGFVLMHRAILGAKKREEYVDHRDGDGLNNQRCNIRICTPAQNSWNRVGLVGSFSRFKGVFWDKKRKKWKAGIGANGKRYNLGIFESEDLAAAAYNSAARDFFGEFAKYNDVFPMFFDVEISDNKGRTNNTSGFRGVSLDKSCGMWVAEICSNRKRKHIGRYATAEQAAVAYDKKVIEFNECRKRLNFPEKKYI